jgi:hypothetical protein
MVANPAGSVDNWRPRLLINSDFAVRLGFIHREGQLVRVAGWILLIAGALLCATLVWATVGFLLLGIGLLSLLVAENNRKQAGRPDASGVRMEQPMVARPTKAASPPPPEPVPVVRREPPMGTSPPASSYDRQAWQQLVESDADLAQIASVLADYGHQYVDELAREYLVDSDKARLPDIVDGIIGRAGQNVAPRGHAAPASDVKPRNPVRGSNAAAPRPDRQPGPLPAPKLEVSEKLQEPAPQPVTLVQPVAPVKQDIVSAPVPPPVTVEPEPDAGDRNKTILSADEELTAMLGRLAPDAATPSKDLK